LELTRLTVSETLKKIKGKEIGIAELVSAYLDQIENLNKTIGAYITVCREDCEKRAEDIQNKLDTGENLPLAGIPAALADNIVTRGVLTTCASKMLHNFIPPYDSTVSEKLRNSGAVLLGKLNMDEFSAGNSNENSYYGPVKNPWDFERVPGGSNGGAAAAVAANMACFAVGSDACGSLRQPASFCGVVGLKPTYGLVSRYGLIAFASSFEQIGPITRSVEDAAVVLNAIAGHDPKDSVSAKSRHPDYTVFLNNDIKGIRMGLPKEYIGTGIQADVRQRLFEALKVFESMGAVVEEVSFPMTEYAVSAYYILSSVEAASNLGRYDGIRYGYRAEHYPDAGDLYKKTRSEGFGFGVKRTIMLGTYFTGRDCYDSFYKKALKARRLVTEDFEKAFDKVDIIVCPTVPVTAFRAGEKADDPIGMHMSYVYTVAANIAGFCAISVPNGTDSKGLPTGLQLIGKPFDEGTLLKAAHAFEKNTRFDKPFDVIC